MYSQYASPEHSFNTLNTITFTLLQLYSVMIYNLTVRCQHALNCKKKTIMKKPGVPTTERFLQFTPDP